MLYLVKDYPPNWEQIKAVFNLEGKNPVFTYGDKLYNPTGLTIPDHLLIHEQVHERQQIIPEAWWKRYLEDGEFRLSQELEAYRAQYQYIKKNVKDRNVEARFLFAIASDLSSGMYGEIISQSEALKSLL